MTFSADLWQGIRPVYATILEHPFIKQLADGSLSQERFAFYMQQDAHYLQDFSRALAITGTRAEEPEERRAFLEFAHGAIVVERALHETYLREFGVTLDVPQAPACFSYTRYLLATASTASYPESVAALLPCFWIYREVGLEIVTAAGPYLDRNPYRRWIETYSGEDFGTSVQRAIAITDAAAGRATSGEREKMRIAFERSARFEWMFWDSAYRLEPWPPAPAEGR
jgi:thiaminase/transcriptional activator TenA